MSPFTSHGFTYRKLTDAHFDEIAASVRQRSISPGIAFARKESNAVLRSDTLKSNARHKVAETFHELSPHLDRPMRVLTMPGLFWKFERLLSAMNRCDYYSVECDPAIYRASVRYMPGYKHHDGIFIVDNATIISKFVYEYKYIRAERYIEISEHRWDCAWLDYTGFITRQKVAAMKQLWSRVDFAMVVTLMEARFDNDSKRQMELHGGASGWIVKEIGSQPSSVHRYCDGVPRVQMTWKKDLS